MVQAHPRELWFVHGGNGGYTFTLSPFLLFYSWFWPYGRHLPPRRTYVHFKYQKLLGIDPFRSQKLRTRTFTHPHNARAPSTAVAILQRRPSLRGLLQKPPRIVLDPRISSRHDLHATSVLEVVPTTYFICRQPRSKVIDAEEGAVSLRHKLQ